MSRYGLAAAAVLIWKPPTVKCKALGGCVLDLSLVGGVLASAVAKGFSLALLQQPKLVYSAPLARIYAFRGSLGIGNPG